VYLKTLTLRGFKSFASTTTLQFEPGITCVVGPNGSGKSNVVDALAWVMGEQGAKSLRGGAMSDVIFAGTRGRPPLGRAEVVLTVDNADRALPLDAPEVTISRTMFRNGGSEYAINGQPCRLLDVSELLSDSGIGREMHVIVGQGQLDTVLHATPEVRRGLVEEAAGVLKHRKRKEKALRKLDATAANMSRLGDLTAELRRQLTPLARQAEAARRAASVQAEVRDARLRLLADDLVRLEAELQRDQSRREQLLDQRHTVEQRVTEQSHALGELDEQQRVQSTEVAALTALVTTLTALRERVDGTLALAGERSRLLVAEPEAAGGPDPDAVDAEAQAAREEAGRLAALVEGAQAALDGAVQRRQAAEDAHAAAQWLAADQQQEQARRQQDAARLSAQVDSLQAALAAAAQELERLESARAEAQARAARARAEFQALESSVGGLSAGEEELDAEHEAAERAVAQLDAALSTATDTERRAERERAAAQSRVDALTLALRRPDATAALLASSQTRPALLGTVAASISVEAGAQSAVAAVLGEVADAAVAIDVGGAADLLAGAVAEQMGRAVLLVAAGAADPAGDAGALAPDPRWPALPAGMRYLVEAVTAPAALGRSLRTVIGPAVLVADLAQARAVVEELDEVLAVTPDGAVLARHVAVGGPAGGSRVELQAELDQARASVAAAEQQADRLRFERARVEAERQQAAHRLDAALDALHHSDAELAAVAERLGQLGHEVRAAEAEAQRAAGAEVDVSARIARDRERLGAAQDRAAAAAAAVETASDAQGSQADLAAEVDRRGEQARQARQHEMNSRLELRTVEERLRIAAGRTDALVAQAAAIRRARVEAQQRRRKAVHDSRVAGWVAEQASVLSARVAAALTAAQAQRDESLAADTERQRTRSSLTRMLRESRDELDAVVEALHRDEVELAEVRLRASGAQERARTEWGVEPTDLVEEYGPHQPVPGADPQAAPSPYVRAEQEQRAERAERTLARLGRINPLALEEHAAAEERLRYLTGQLDDLQRTRRDLLAIVREVDDRVETVFAEAFADTAREFETVFARLFPGGDGRLVLTEPDDLLATGIEVEARPPGKRVKRLSLLSGGERALVAVAFLVALFRARPSPFYVLDEVEAALDDVNLGRLLDLYEELRETSQLLVITHQKRTMEIADSLYGVSMRSDGVSAVISQRLREPEVV
jgi:chromosome segregation protein